MAKYFNVSSSAQIATVPKIMVWNIANARRDNEMSPLCDRLDNIIKVVKSNNPDVVVFLEAGRPSKSLLNEEEYTWTQMANKIETGTGLTYEGVWRMAPQLMAFGKAVFVRYNTPTTAVKIDHMFVGPKSDMWNDELYGSVLRLSLYPFDGTTIDESHCYQIGVVHFPMPLEKRLFHAKWLVEEQEKFDLLVGDMNTFSDNGGAELLSIMASAGFVEQLPADTPFTFKGFKHDVITIPNENLK